MSRKEYVIPFIGLKTGSHVFEYDLTDAFFEGIEDSIIHRGNVHVRLDLEKKETMLVGIYHVEGSVTTECDRCTDPIEVEVEGEYQIVYKIGGGDVSDDEALVVLEKDAFEVDIEMNLYELVAVSLPLRKIHEIEDCNQDMIALLEKYVVNSLEDDEDDEDFDDDDFDDDDEDSDDDDDFDEESDNDIEGNKDNDDIDPRWSILKNLN
jgi:uncharacterized metal-binding protein YceD (DUF177 family)